MIEVKFKNFEKSELAREAASEKTEFLLEEFPDLKASKILITLERHDLPYQVGPDLFKTKLQIVGGKYGGLSFSKANSNLYIALEDLVEHVKGKLDSQF